MLLHPFVWELCDLPKVRAIARPWGCRDVHANAVTTLATVIAVTAHAPARPSFGTLWRWTSCQVRSEIPSIATGKTASTAVEV